jgi:hypothetical protein
MENYRAMMSRKQPSDRPSELEETVDPGSYASATEAASGI